MTARLVALLMTGSALAVAAAGCGGDPYDKGAGVYSTTTATRPAQTAPAFPGSPERGNQSAVPGSPDLDQSGEQGAPPSGPQLRSAVDAGRRFLAEYVPYTYGQARARSIQAAHPDLLRQLAQRPPSVLPALRRLHPRVIDVAVNGGRSGEVALLASVNDGRQQYTIPLTVTQQRDRRWLVTSVS